MTYFHLGFTGTRQGLTERQIYDLNLFMRIFLIEHGDECIIAHHGDCVGADAQFHKVVDHPSFDIIIHPPKISTYRAYCTGERVTILPTKDYLDRNHDIVDASDLMVATPKEKTEQLRSGTWSTIRYAWKMNIPVIILEP